MRKLSNSQEHVGRQVQILRGEYHGMVGRIVRAYYQSANTREDRDGRVEIAYVAYDVQIAEEGLIRGLRWEDLITQTRM